MKKSSIGFIGSGRVAAFMLEGFARKGTQVAAVLSDSDASVSALRARAFPGVRDAGTDFAAAAAAADAVFVALHPPVVAGAAASIASAIGSDAVVVSLAPKVKLAALEAALGTAKVARFLPNAPSAIGAGFNPISFGAGVPEKDRAALVELLSALGEVVEVPESEIEAFAVLCAMGPTYIWPLMDEMARLGAEFGLTDEASRNLVSRMFSGSAALFGEPGRSYATLMDMIPLKPMADDETSLRSAFAARLGGMFKKLTHKEIDVKIQILGMGCPKCNALEKNARDAAAELALDAEFEKIKDIDAIHEMGVMMTPALAVDGDVKSVGKLLTKDQIVAVLQARA